MFIHIGVGSNVVCSTAMGNGRALIRGMGNADSTLFLCHNDKRIIQNKCL